MTETLAQAPVLDTPTPAPETTATTSTNSASTAEPATASAAPAATEPASAPAPAPAAWPEDWRTRLAEGDEKRLKQLERYSDVAALAKKAFSLEAKLSSGEYKRDLPKDAKPEEIAEWRKERGLPETAEGYKPELPDGIVLGETDKETLEGFQKFAFENNVPTDVFNKNLAWYFAEQDRVTKLQETRDIDYHEESKDSLMAEWGLKDYRNNLAAMGAMRDQMPQGLADRILTGRTADGRLIGDDPAFLKWFASVAREMNPHATVVNVDAGKTVSGELESIRKFRRENPTGYDQDKAMQARELELLTAQQRLGPRG